MEGACVGVSEGRCDRLFLYAGNCRRLACGRLWRKLSLGAKSILRQNTEQADSHFRKVEGMYACPVRTNRPHRARQSALERPVGMEGLLGESHEPN